MVCNNTLDYLHTSKQVSLSIQQQQQQNACGNNLLLGESINGRNKLQINWKMKCATWENKLIYSWGNYFLGLGNVHFIGYCPPVHILWQETICVVLSGSVTPQ